ncbi:hypothetical protein FQN60_002224, partial [Etheostoma spectabile]
MCVILLKKKAPRKKMKMYSQLPYATRPTRTAGEVMAASLAQGGPCTSFKCEWCFRYFCSGDADSIQVSASDVTGLELSQLIVKINSASDDNISNLIGDIVTCKYTGIVSVDKRHSMIRAVILHSTMRLIPMLDQLRKGLQLYELPKIMKTHQYLWKTLQGKMIRYILVSTTLTQDLI